MPTNRRTQKRPAPQPAPESAGEVNSPDDARAPQDHENPDPSEAPASLSPPKEGSELARAIEGAEPGAPVDPAGWHAGARGQEPMRAPPVDLNAFAWDVGPAILNIDQSLRRLCDGLERNLGVDVAGTLSRGVIKLGSALERLASMAEARELARAYAQLEKTEVREEDEEYKLSGLKRIADSIDVHVGPLLSVQEQVAATPQEGTGGDGGEAASPGDDIPEGVFDSPSAFEAFEPGLTEGDRLDRLRELSDADIAARLEQLAQGDEPLTREEGAEATVLVAERRRRGLN